MPYTKITCPTRLPPNNERGVVLFIALIALIAMTLSGIALMRSLDTGNVIAGNLAFREASLQATDIGIEAGFIALPTLVNAKDTNVANQYYATIQNVDSRGIPTGIVWASVPCRDNSNAVVTCSAQTYQVKYVIDRMCYGPAPVTDIQGKCYADITSGSKGGSKGSFSAIFTSADAVYYRVTVQVTGPKNTVSYVQAIVARS